MVEDVEGVLKKEWHKEDFKALTSVIREHESLLKLKRRWLMDLPLSTREQKRIEEILPPNDKILPESFLREDDVSYEEIRTCIEKAFGTHNCGKETFSVHEDVRLPNSCNDLHEIFFLLDAMTNKGLYSCVEILTEGMIKFEKTNWKMKRIIRELLPEVVGHKNDISEVKLKQLFQVLEDPDNFRGNQKVLSTASGAYRMAGLKLLDELEDFPCRALLAMHRKLKGVRGYTPSIQNPKSGKGRDSLISFVRERCMEMLSGISEVNEPSEQLAGVLGIAGLTLKFMMNRPTIREFRKFSPEIEALQNDIANAIHSLNEKNKVSLRELKKVQILLDSNFQLSNRSLRIAVRNLLTDYLYECSDMEKVPDCLVETLDIINRKSELPSRNKCSSSEAHSSPQELIKEVILKEVECVLIISAQAKEVVSNLLPEHVFDEEFARAYMEDYELSETLCASDDGDQIRDTSQCFEFHSSNSYVQTESVGETNLAEVNFPISTSIRDGCFASTSKYVFSDFREEDTNILSQQSRSVNEYVEVQEACDVTSMVAYRFVGDMLDKLAKTEGLVLSEDDRLYLQGCSSVREDSEENSNHRTFKPL